MQVGAHVSVAKGYPAALEYARSVGCECIQVFAKSPRQWHSAAPDARAAAEFIALRDGLSFGPVFTHTAYLINLSSVDPELRDKSVSALADELLRGQTLGVAGVVTHIGNDPHNDPSAAARRAADSIVRAFERAGGDACTSRLLLENTAGSGTTFGGSFEQLDETISETALPAHRLGVCFDTCHGFARGYELDTAEGWATVARSLADVGGGSRLGLIHANDCMFERGSRKDRHAWIGEGRIGETGFGAMMCQPLLRDTPVVTEMPGEPPEKDAVNVARLKEMKEACEGDGVEER